MRTQTIPLLLVAGVLLSTLAVGQQRVHSYTPPNGFIPDSLTAVRVAAAILAPIYGQEQIRKELPLRASLSDSVWTVNGSLPPGFVGGVATIELSKRDARVLRVTHSR